jgi:hypothetical protein
VGTAWGDRAPQRRAWSGRASPVVLAFSPSRLLAFSPSRLLAFSPSRLLAFSPSRLHALHALHPFTPSPLHPFTPSPLHPFTPSPLHALHALHALLAFSPSRLSRLASRLSPLASRVALQESALRRAARVSRSVEQVLLTGVARCRKLRKFRARRGRWGAGTRPAVEATNAGPGQGRAMAPGRASWGRARSRSRGEAATGGPPAGGDGKRVGPEPR